MTKEELFRACWPDTAVSQTVLRVCISEIRAVLAEDATGSTAIESAGRRGYRLAAPAGELDQPAAPIGRERQLIKHIVKGRSAPSEAGIAPRTAR